MSDVTRAEIPEVQGNHTLYKQVSSSWERLLVGCHFVFNPLWFAVYVGYIHVYHIFFSLLDYFYFYYHCFHCYIYTHTYIYTYTSVCVCVRTIRVSDDFPWIVPEDSSPARRNLIFTAGGVDRISFVSDSHHERLIA